MSRKSQVAMSRLKVSHREELRKVAKELRKCDEDIKDAEQRLHYAQVQRLSILGTNMALLTDVGILNVKVNEYDLEEIQDDLDRDK